MSNVTIELTKAQRTEAEQALCNHKAYHGYIKLYKKIEFEWAYERWGEGILTEEFEYVADEEKQRFWRYPELYYGNINFRTDSTFGEMYHYELYEVAFMMAKNTYLEYRELKKDYLLHTMAMHYVMYEWLLKEGK